MRSMLEKVKKSQPEAVLLNPNPGVTSESLVKQLAEIKDWSGYQLFGQIAFINPELLAIAPEVLEGMIVVDSPSVNSEELLSVIAAIEESGMATINHSLHNLSNFDQLSRIEGAGL